MRAVSFAMPARRRAILALLMLAALAGGGTPAWAQGFGDLIVSPTRVELQGRTRSATVSLTNKGSQTALFRISLVTMVMADDGSLKAVDKPEPGQLTAEHLVRYAPRQVNIAPGATQTVRLVVRKPKDLPAGEYRSHMFFRAVPPEDTGRSVAGTEDKTGIRIKLTPIFGITIPVIVRNGDLNVTSGIKDLALKDGKQKGQKVLDVSLTRTGTESSYGDLEVQYVPAAGGAPVVVGQVTRLAVYTPNLLRKIQIPLALPRGVTLGKGTLKVRYRQVNGDATLASGELALQ